LQRWIVLPDMQVPYHDPITLRAVERYMAAHRFDGYVNLGDLCDFNEISSYNDGAPGRVTERIDSTFRAVNEILDRHQAIIRKRNPAARFVLLEGNHDYRATAYTEKHPELGKTLNVPLNLRLREREFEWVPSWSKGKLFKLGNAYFTHGLIVSRYHAANMAARFGVCIYYGHTHDVMEFPIVLHGADKTIVGKSLGCLCRYDQKYLKGAPTNWQQAFAVFYVLPDGFYTEHTMRIFKHRFVGTDGVVYDGKEAA
jgi:Calcineurin-like phosphoesterase.